ncbi:MULTISPECIES: transferrin-binding protein-like solute binding protein [unclassified Sphingobium]|uniref:transferrin-binding protein-like solute binding protein n=1 Tax=unclassified Sphingobium TaxID=2611147 RepID=UPI00222567F6|nr:MULTISPECIES: transferrin-binding protein-like solute binding protein [unclassified Sphingobium]MCW2393982.1 hypothetical protein [Sphingobium sp. B8D3B]MCW2417496.1 hypothetical protein [Sphingobium sp. B8D3C]
MGPLQSQTFTSNGGNLSGRFYADERPVENGQSARGTLSISYNAATQSYSIATANRSATFAPADLVASGSPAFISFQKLGTTSEALTLTRPGTSGELTYRYVGGGAWERATVSGNTLDFTYDPFTYGIQTPAGQLQPSGTGRYAVSLVGARAIDSPFAVAGSGALQIDFQTGALTSSGVLTTIDVDTGLIKGIGAYFGEAALTSGTTAFSGNFFMDDGKRFNGGWDGRFYGPNGEEVGATWYLYSADGEVTAGYMLGRQDSTVAGLNMSLTTLQFDDSFEHRFSQLSLTDTGNGNSANNAALLRSNGLFTYNAAQGSYRYQDSDRGIDTTFGSASLDSAASSNALAVYRITGGDGLSYTLSLNKAGSGNTAIALSYASFGRWERAQAPGSDRLDRWFAWGIRTNGFQIPTGSGSFTGIIRGTAAQFGGGATYALSGTSNFAVNFGAGTFTGSLNPIGKSNFDGSTRNFGTFTFDRGVMDIDAGLTADVVNGSNAYLGFFEGALYGPTATEIGGTFGFQTAPGDTSSTYYLSGATVGKRTN